MTALLRFVDQRLKEEKVTVPAALRKAVVEELTWAIEPPLHEGTLQPYGAIITSSHESLKIRVQDAYQSREHSLLDHLVLRSSADGVRSFYCRYLPQNGEERKSLWISEALAFSSEDALFSLRDEAVFKQPGIPPHKSNPVNDLMIVQRNSFGEVRLLSTSGILLITQGHWSVRKYQYALELEEFVTKSSLVGEGDKETLERVYRSIARLAVHILGAQGIGATLLVESRESEFKDNREVLNSTRSLDVRGLHLSILTRADQTVIAHILAHNDGAAVFSYGGKLLSVRNWLTASYESADVTSNPGGTRQLSATSASRHTSLPIVTVSSDGPVRAFYRGEMVRGQKETRRGVAS